jgi:predicted secreted hydrolase
MRLHIKHVDFELNLTLGDGKGAVWHCDNGLLRMGIDKPGQTTGYYSYTNMPLTGSLILNGNTIPVKGKSWFDKQGGTYAIKNRNCMWEWFSLRFFDDEEMMLFSFPQSKYQDGTYIRADGEYQRLTDYEITPTQFVFPDGKTKYSAGWAVFIPGLKDERYTITPLLEGQMNMGYFEQLAGIYNEKGDQAGLCFVELLPGVYNTKYPITMFRRSK